MVRGFTPELMPGKVGTVAGLFFGLSFGIGAISSAALGVVGDAIGNHSLFTVCSGLPMPGVVAVFCPNCIPAKKAIKSLAAACA